MAELVKTPGVDKAMTARGEQNQAGINKAYDSGLAAQKQGLLDAYNANTAAQAQQGQSIRQNAGVANYDVGVQNARNEGNVTRFADIRDANTGAGSQHRLNLASARAAATGNISNIQQQALQENQRQKDLMTASYQNQVQSALKDNDYKRAAALLDDYNNQNKWADQQAQILASYGDFSGYRPLYGDTAADGMQRVWNAQHPEEAYRTGQISAEQFRQITGGYPAGYTPPWSGGWGGWGYGGPVTDDEGNIKIGGSINQMQALSNFTRGISNAGRTVAPLAASGQTLGGGGFSQYHT